MTWEVCSEKGTTSNFPKSQQPKKKNTRGGIFPNRPGQKKKDKFQTSRQNNNNESGWSDNKYKCTQVTNVIFNNINKDNKSDVGTWPLIDWGYRF